MKFFGVFFCLHHQFPSHLSNLFLPGQKDAKWIKWVRKQRKMNVRIWSKPSDKWSDMHIEKYNKPIISEASALGLVWLKNNVSRMKVGKNKIDITPLLRNDISVHTEWWYSLIKRENDPLSRKCSCIAFSPVLAQDPQGDRLEWPYICQWLSFVLLLLQQIILDSTYYLQHYPDRDQSHWHKHWSNLFLHGTVANLR